MIMATCNLLAACLSNASTSSFGGGREEACDKCPTLGAPLVLQRLSPGTHFESAPSVAQRQYLLGLPGAGSPNSETLHKMPLGESRRSLLATYLSAKASSVPKRTMPSHVHNSPSGAQSSNASSTTLHVPPRAHTSNKSTILKRPSGQLIEICSLSGREQKTLWNSNASSQRVDARLAASLREA